MKNLKIWSGIILIIAAFLFGGCYTQLAMNNGYGSGNDQGYQNGQTPADSLYGDQYGYSDSSSYYQNGNFNDYYNQPPWSWDNYYYGYPSFTRYPFWRYNFSLGFGWGDGFYNPYYWDPYGLWTGYYPGYWGPYPYYPSYYNPYYGYYGSYYGGYGYYNNGHQYTRSREMIGLRNDNGGGRGDRNRNGRDGNSGIYSTSSSRPEPYSTTGSNNNARRPASVSNTNNNRNQSRSSGRTYRSPRNNNGRNQGYTGSRSGTRRQENRPTYSQPGNRGSSSYHPRSEPRSYQPPRSYSPPARTYSAPRSYSPPPSRSEGGSRGGSDRNRGR